jgi:hypothetical protein
MDIELIRMAVVYVHLIACCIAIGLVVTSDIAMVKKLIRTDPCDTVDREHLAMLERVVLRALIALWVSGITLVALDTSIKGWSYFGNPKLQCKIAIVMILTLNGYMLHQHVLPLMQKAGSLLKLSLHQRTVAIFTGAVSGVSWLYVAMLGIARPLNWKYSFGQIAFAYPMLIVGGFVSMMLLTQWAKSRSSKKHRTFETPFSNGPAFAVMNNN